ncbi:MAG: DUF2179 domain-containing protein [Anaerolineae bacterium]|nr:DUF2179 domain-containing protein [Anaerolineae bacterium]
MVIELVLTPEAILTAIFILVLRVLNTGLGTVRVIIVNRGHRFISSVMAFIEALLFAYTISTVATDFGNVLNLAAYCLGFSLGNYIGMVIESRYFLSFVTVNIISKSKGHEIALALREAGYGVTESLGEGREGMVTMLKSMVDSRQMPQLLRIVQQIHNEAFVAVEPARPIYRGWLGSGRISY